jgi:hypothetical protein
MSDIITTEFGYYLIAELVTMEDRILAQKIELDIWACSPTPRASRLQSYISALKESENDSDFYIMAEQIVKNSELIFIINGNQVSAHVPS